MADDKNPLAPLAARAKPERQEMLAMMLATGRFTVKQISTLLHVDPATIRTMRNSPVFKQLIQKYQQTIYHSLVDAALGEVLADAPDNVAFLKDVRDGEVPAEPDELRVRLRAAEVLFDRQVPKQQADDKGAGVRITINTDLRDRADQADKELEEFGALEVEAEEIEE